MKKVICKTLIVELSILTLALMIGLSILLPSHMAEATQTEKYKGEAMGELEDERAGRISQECSDYCAKNFSQSEINQNPKKNRGRARRLLNGQSDSGQGEVFSTQ